MSALFPSPAASFDHPIDILDGCHVRILRNCRRAMRPGNTLLVVERALQQVDALSTAVHDLTMLVLFGGRDRTVDGYRALLERAGFEVVRTARGATGICLIEARAQESAGSPR